MGWYNLEVKEWTGNPKITCCVFKSKKGFMVTMSKAFKPRLLLRILMPQQNRATQYSGVSLLNDSVFLNKLFR